MSRKAGAHLTYEIRCQIDVFFSIGMSRRVIGRKLCIHHSTIAREIKRNSSKKGYKFQEAEAKKQKRRSVASSRSYRLKKEIQEQIKLLLFDVQASSQQISGRLKKQGISISHQTIYSMIKRDKADGQTLYLHLRHKGILVTLVDRATKFTLIRLIDSKTAFKTTDAVLRMLKPYESYVQTITADNGLEFADHATVSLNLPHCDVFSQNHIILGNVA